VHEKKPYNEAFMPIIELELDFEPMLRNSFRRD
jgi:hypothetical protein